MAKDIYILLTNIKYKLQVDSSLNVSLCLHIRNPKYNSIHSMLKSYPHPITKTKLILNVMLTLTTLTLFTLVTMLTLLTLIVTVKWWNSLFLTNKSFKPSQQCCIYKQTATGTITGHQLALGELTSRCLVFSAYSSGSRCGVSEIICPVPDV